VIFVDEAGEVCARRWCWRQSAASAAGEKTVDAIVTVEGHHEDAERDVTAALEDLRAHLGTAVVASAVLSPTHPELVEPRP
jgi:DNA/RNA-binding domain of Phe-tRNA-synthetase-like protein